MHLVVIRAFALHPGGIAGTNLGTHVGVEMLQNTGFVDENGRPVIDLARDLKSVPQGAATHVWCAVNPQLDGKGGVFCADSDITPVLPEGGTRDLTEDRTNRGTGVEAFAIDPDFAEELWRRSEKITNTSIRSNSWRDNIAPPIDARKLAPGHRCGRCMSRPRPASKHLVREAATEPDQQARSLWGLSGKLLPKSVAVLPS
ncbi:MULTISPECIES: hypothetical protein [unclassified Xanthobacter]|uniref:hypothetical protein n=1 Tax=unclassified Xanthobacter TaxID=2623496 RepID=UPI001F1FF834|nr:MULTISPECIES: hypothetical protein [unclassified Xanthobacter]